MTGATMTSALGKWRGSGFETLGTVKIVEGTLPAEQPHLPTWLTVLSAFGGLSAPAAWFALWLGWKKQRGESPSIKFNVQEGLTSDMEGNPNSVQGLLVTLTNTGAQPVTIVDVFCVWSRGYKGKLLETTGRTQRID
jgi:hypothetical protein